MKPGDTFHIAGHLWVVASLPIADGSIAMVNFTSHAPPCDETCVVSAGEHPFIKHKTIIKYCWATMVTPQKQAEVKQRARPDAPVSAKLLERIQKGALVSEATKPKIAAAIEATLAQQKPTAKP